MAINTPSAPRSAPRCLGGAFGLVDQCIGRWLLANRIRRVQLIDGSICLAEI
jgi:hypothetical protein